jgi:hypothetical protein
VAEQEAADLAPIAARPSLLDDGGPRLRRELDLDLGQAGA